MRRGKTVKIGEVIEKLSRRYGFERDLRIWLLRKAWVEKFGKFSRHVMPEDYRRKAIYLHTDSPVWKTELSYLKDEILEALNPLVNFPIKKVVIKVAPFKPWEEGID